jgi:hypothetical protein
MEKKGDLQVSFGWLFAIIVGGIILFIAIFGVTRLFGQEQETVSAKTGKEIGILLNPLETSFESGKTASFTLPAETRIYNRCENEGNFGKQGIMISQKSFNQWTETEVKPTFENKYIFSRDYAEGKTFYLFSKPFIFPFKVADLVILTSTLDTYCFDNAPENIEEEIINLGQKNLLPNCVKIDDEKVIKICFSKGKNCDIDVDYDGGKVIGKKGAVYFAEDALMYAAIFSDKDVYECQLKRLMQRVAQLASIYNEKKLLISKTGCGSNLDLTGLISQAEEITSSSGIISMSNYIVKDIQTSNDGAGECKLW